MNTNPHAAIPELSVVVPVFNERDNIGPLVGEIDLDTWGPLAEEVRHQQIFAKGDAERMLNRQ